MPHMLLKLAPYILIVLLSIASVYNPLFLQGLIICTLYLYARTSSAIYPVITGLSGCLLSYVLGQLFQKPAPLEAALTGLLLVTAIIVSDKILKDRIEVQINRSNNLISQIMGNIIKESNRSTDQVTISSACENILKGLKEYYHFDTFTLFTESNRRLIPISSNVPKEAQPDFVDYINSQVTSLNDKNENGLILSCGDDSTTLSYQTAKNREIKYLSITLLKSGTRLVGALVIENKSIYHITNREVEFFNTVKDSITLVLQNILYQDKIYKSSMTDELTTLYNRKYMNLKMAEEIANHSKVNQSLVIALIDIDHFKKFNDTYGHLFGDKVLRTIAQHIKAFIRDEDYAFRFGGEEMCILIYNTSIQTIMSRIETLRESIASLNIECENKESTCITVSIGLSEYPRNGNTAVELIEVADQALYKAKERGRNRIEVI